MFMDHLKPSHLCFPCKNDHQGPVYTCGSLWKVISGGSLFREWYRSRWHAFRTQYAAIPHLALGCSSALFTVACLQLHPAVILFYPLATYIAYMCSGKEDRLYHPHHTYVSMGSRAFCAENALTAFPTQWPSPWSVLMIGNQQAWFLIMWPLWMPITVITWSANPSHFLGIQTPILLKGGWSWARRG